MNVYVLLSMRSFIKTQCYCYAFMNKNRLSLTKLRLTLCKEFHLLPGSISIYLKHLNLVQPQVRVYIDALVVRYAHPAYWSKTMKEVV